MQCQVAYQVGQFPGRFQRLPTGTLFINETGLRVDGPVSYSADYSDIKWLKTCNKEGLVYEAGDFYIAVGASEPLFIKPIVTGWFGCLWITKPRLNRTVHKELLQHLNGLDRCAEGRCYVDLDRAPCPLCPVLGPKRRRIRLRYLFASVLAALLVVYVATYLQLSRRGMREAKVYGMAGFLYVPVDEVIEPEDLHYSLSRHYTRSRLYTPINELDQLLFGARGPVRGMTFGLSKQSVITKDDTVE
ncbi:MAG: hypothetical protein ACJ8FY_01550 [Gemmataceae bacterium]